MPGNIVNNPHRGKIMVKVGIQFLHCNAVGSPGMLGLKGRRGMRWYVLGSWGARVLTGIKVGADAKAPWTCVCSRYDLLKCALH